MLYMILFGGIFFVSLQTIVGSITEYEALFIQTCTIFQSERSQVLNLLDIYEQSLGNPTIYAYWRNVRMFIGGSLLSITVGKILICAIFVHHLYRHDNTERLIYLLGIQTIKKRNRDNATTFLGQLATFGLNIVFLIFLNLTVKMSQSDNRFMGVTMVIGGIGFTSVSILEVFISAPLRLILFEK